jgi:hypothetical protein
MSTCQQRQFERIEQLKQKFIETFPIFSPFYFYFFEKRTAKMNPKDTFSCLLGKVNKITHLLFTRFTAKIKF